MPTKLRNRSKPHKGAAVTGWAFFHALPSEEKVGIYLQHRGLVVRGLNEGDIEWFDLLLLRSSFEGGQVMRKVGGVFQSVVVALCVFAGVANGVARGDEHRPAAAVRGQKAGAAAEKRCQLVANAWRATMRDVRSSSRLEKLARELGTSFEEKVFDSALSYAGSPGQIDPVTASFRRHVVNEQDLIKRMVADFDKLQGDLTAESLDMMVKSGMPRDKALKSIPKWTVNQAAWTASVDGVIAKARRMAEDDWFRAGCVSAGAEIAGSLITDAARQTGQLDVEDGSWAELFAGIAVGLVVEAALIEATDPTADFVRQLNVEMAAMETSLLDGPHGMLSVARNMAAAHDQLRQKLPRVSVKGGR